MRIMYGGQRKDTFRPKVKIEKGTLQHELYKTIKKYRSLGSGDALRNAVKLPAGHKLEDWIAVHGTRSGSLLYRHPPVGGGRTREIAPHLFVRWEVGERGCVRAFRCCDADLRVLGTTVDAWLGAVVVDFYNSVNLLYGAVTMCCSPESCPVMSAGKQYAAVSAHARAMMAERVVGSREWLTLVDRSPSARLGTSICGRTTTSTDSP